jgi:hypothetical protein
MLGSPSSGLAPAPPVAVWSAGGRCPFRWPYLDRQTDDARRESGERRRLMPRGGSRILRPNTVRDPRYGTPGLCVMSPQIRTRTMLVDDLDDQIENGSPRNMSDYDPMDDVAAIELNEDRWEEYTNGVVAELGLNGREARLFVEGWTRAA